MILQDPIFTFIFVSIIFTFFLLSSFDSIGQASSQISPNNNPQSNAFKYYGPSEEISILYPSDWSVSEISRINGTFFQSPTLNAGVIVQVLLKGESDSIFVSNMSKLVNSLTNTFNDLKLFNSTVFNMSDGTVFQNLTYSYVKNSLETKIMQISMDDNSSSFVFSYFSPLNQFDRFFPQIKAMYNSLHSLSFQKIFNNDFSDSTIESKTLTKGGLVPKDQNISSNPVNNTSNGENRSSIVKTAQDSTGDVISEYSNPYFGIKASYPTIFQKVETDNGVAFMNEDGNLGFTIGYAPSLGMTLDSFVENQVRYLNQSFDDFKVINTTYSQIYEKPTQAIIFSYSNKSIPYNGMTFVTLDENNAYMYTYFAHEEIFNDYVDTVTGILESIELRTIPKLNDTQ